MKLHNLPRIVKKSKKIIGRGIGSGRGKTSGRGTKGQKARGKIPLAFIGGSLPLHKKLPYVRGWTRRGSNKIRTDKPVIIKSSELNKFKPKSEVDVSTLIEAGIIKTKAVNKKSVKILASGDIKIALNVKVPVSAKVKQMIEKAGGKVVG